MSINQASYTNYRKMIKTSSALIETGAINNNFRSQPSVKRCRAASVIYV